MRVVLVALIFGLSISAWADNHGAHGAKKGPKFEEHKKKMLTQIDKRIAALNDHKACVQGAADRPAVKACHKKMKSMRMEWKENRMDRKEKRKMRKMKDES